MLEARDIQVTLGRKPVLGGVDFTALAGRVTVIVGPNGSGKTTLLRVLTDALPHSGKVRLDGVALHRQPAWALAERRAVLPQSSQLAFPFTVHEVVRLGLAGSAALRPDAAQLPALALARVGLSGYGGAYFQELSGGEQARVQLARVLVQVWEPVVDGVPRWLFLDEPVAALDIGHQLQIMGLVREFACRGGGVVAVMHDLNLTAMFADELVLMKEGRVLADGPVARVMTDANLSRAYDWPLQVSALPKTGARAPFILPQAAGQAAGPGGQRAASAPAGLHAASAASGAGPKAGRLNGAGLGPGPGGTV